MFVLHMDGKIPFLSFILSPSFQTKVFDNQFGAESIRSVAILQCYKYILYFSWIHSVKMGIYSLMCATASSRGKAK